jgi:hypothetical protein
MYLAAERDQFTPLAGIRELVGRTPSATRLFVLRAADHDHFSDDPPPPPPEREVAHRFTRGLALAHLDASLRGDAAAEAWLAESAAAALEPDGYQMEA